MASLSDREIAAQLGVSTRTVRRLRASHPEATTAEALAEVRRARPPGRPKKYDFVQGQEFQGRRIVDPLRDEKQRIIVQCLKCKREERVYAPDVAGHGCGHCRRPRKLYLKKGTEINGWRVLETGSGARRRIAVKCLVCKVGARRSIVNLLDGVARSCYYCRGLAQAKKLAAIGGRDFVLKYLLRLPGRIRFHISRVEIIDDAPGLREEVGALFAKDAELRRGRLRSDLIRNKARRLPESAL